MKKKTIEAQDLENHIKVANTLRILEQKDREKKEEKYSNKEFPKVSEFIGSLQLQSLKINSSKSTKGKCKRGNIERLTIKTQIGYRRSLYRERQIPYHKQWNAKE